MPVFTYYPVTGANDRDGIQAIGGAYSPDSGRSTYLCGETAVAGYSAEGNLQQRLPDAFLEGGTFQAERHIECMA